MIMATLRQTTRTHHDQIEAALSLMRDDITREDYVSYLQKAYGFYLPWEAKAYAFLHAYPALAAPSLKLSLIEKDLRFFIPSIDLNALALCNALPDTMSLPAIMGSLYVLEGSTLGNQFITKHLKAALNLDGPGCEFIACYGKETAVRWKQFGQTMETFATPANEAAIIASACATFDSMRHWFCMKSEVTA